MDTAAWEPSACEVWHPTWHGWAAHKGGDSYDTDHSIVTLTVLSSLISPPLANIPKCQLLTETPHCSLWNLEVNGCQWHW